MVPITMLSFHCLGVHYALNFLDAWCKGRDTGVGSTFALGDWSEDEVI